MKNKDDFDISVYPTKPLKDLAEVVSGVTIPRYQRAHKGVWQLIRGRNIVRGTVVPSNLFIPEEIVKKHPKAIVLSNDILISILFGKYKIGVVPGELGPSFIDKGVVRIRPKKIQQEYLIAYLGTKLGKTTILEQLLKATRGNVIKFVTVSDIRKLQIPILPFEILEGLDEEILQKGPIEELKNVYYRYEQEIVEIVRKLLHKKGWKDNDIIIGYRISGSLIADIVLRKNDKPVAIIEIKKDARHIRSIIRQIKMMCEVAQIQFGYLVTEKGIWGIRLKEIEVSELSDFPAPNEIK